MANVKVKVLSAVVGNYVQGQTLEVSEAEARYLVNLGYVEEVKSEDKAPAKKAPARKQATKASDKPAAKTSDKE